MVKDIMYKLLVVSFACLMIVGCAGVPIEDIDWVRSYQHNTNGEFLANDKSSGQKSYFLRVFYVI